jgi:hypothetical protein
MTTKQQIAKQLDELSNSELVKVKKYVGFLKKRSGNPRAKLSDKSIQNLYRQFAAQDREIAEEGMGDYLESLKREDVE